MNSKKMKKRPNSDGNNCDVPKKKLLKENCTSVEQKKTIKESVTKRKATDELIGYENKKKCAETSSNKKAFTNYNTMHADALERTMKLKENVRNLEKIQNTWTFDELKNSYPHRLLSLMYQIELSILCLIKKSIFENSTRQVFFENSTSGQFNNISLKFNNEAFQIMVQHIDTYYLKECLNFNSFFSTRQGNFTLRNYLNEFAFQFCYSSLEKQSNYLILYTNGNLDLTEDGKLRHDELKNLEFVELTLETDPNLINLLKGTNNNGKESNSFYRFANNQATKSDLKFLVKFTKSMESYIMMKGYSFSEIRDAFFERLIFAVNQPSIEEIVEIVRTEIRGTRENYSLLRNRVLRQLKASDDKSRKKLQNLSSIVYSFDLFNLCVHDTFVNKNPIKFHDTFESCDIAVNLKSSFLYLRVVDADVIHLPIEDYIKQQESFAIDSQFAFFLQHLDEDLEYFVIYTNGSLPLIEDLILGTKFRNIADVFCRVDTNREKYSPLRQTYIKSDNNNLYRFTEKAKRGLSPILNSFSALKKTEKLAHLSKSEIKELFLDKVIFAVKQYDSEEIYKRLEKSSSLNCTQLAKIAFCFLKRRSNGSLTKGKIFTFLKSPQSSSFETSSEEIELAERVLILQETQEFSQFMEFLTKGIGGECLDTYRENGIKISSIALILSGSKRKGAKKVFLDLYNLLFTRKRNKSRLLHLFEKAGFTVEMLAKIFNGSGSKAPEVLNELYQHWFCSESDCLSPLRLEGIDAEKLTILLEETGAECLKKFHELNALWFDTLGKKTDQLELLEENGINLKILFSILFVTDSTDLNKTFHYQSLYDLWFNENGEMTPLVKNLQNLGIGLKNIASVLIGSGKAAAEVFQKLYHLWFDYKERKTVYLLKFEDEGIPLRLIFDVLAKTGENIVSTFLQLYRQWFEPDGTRTQCLKILEANGICLGDVCKLLCNEGSQVKTFENIYQSLSPQFSPREIKTEIEEVEIQNLVETEKLEIGEIAEKTLQPEHSEQEKNTEESVEVKLEIDDTVQMENFEKETNTLLREIKQEISNVKVEIDSDYEIFCNDSFIERLTTDYMEIIQSVEIQSDKSEEINNCTERRKTIASRNNSKAKIHKKESKFIKIVSSFNDEFPEDSELLKFLLEGDGRRYLKVLRKNKIPWKLVAKVLNGCSSNAEVVQEFTNLYKLWFNDSGEQRTNLQCLEKSNLKLRHLLKILIGSGKQASREFENLQQVLIDSSGGKTLQLKSFEENGINFGRIQKVLKKTGDGAAQKFLILYELFFDSDGGESFYLKNVKIENLTLEKLMKILYKTGRKADQLFLEIYQIFFSFKGNKNAILLDFEKNGVNLAKIGKILSKTGERAIEIFENFSQFFFDREGRKQKHLLILEQQVPIGTILEIVDDDEKDFNCIEELYDIWFDSKGNPSYCLQSLEELGINLECLTKFLKGTGNHASEIFCRIFLYLFDQNGNKTLQAMNLEKIIELRAMFEIVTGAKKGVFDIFVELYNMWFDSQGRKTNRLLVLEKNGISLMDISIILNGSGAKAVKRFKTLSDCVTKRKLNKYKLFIRLFEKK
ncbi:uncharacterized protein LOC122509592 [Leptopilina heterotoma]|uniref:uncharacterized protein LOC122509592 n=1 Tax=Leptopilina heterotoma TaxID=63436 RepID=UPI001CA9436E|nr:uncharacterized protein LOC122509592 [Leptopilina heterotoma]